MTQTLIMRSDCAVVDNKDCWGTIIRPDCTECKGLGVSQGMTCVTCQIAMETRQRITVDVNDGETIEAALMEYVQRHGVSALLLSVRVALQDSGVRLIDPIRVDNLIHEASLIADGIAPSA